MPISINEAVTAGITKLRLDNWSNPQDHIEVTIIIDEQTGKKSIGPWWKLWSPLNEAINGENPVKRIVTLLGDLDAPVWTIFPLDPSS